MVEERAVNREAAKSVEVKSAEVKSVEVNDGQNPEMNESPPNRSAWLTIAASIFLFALVTATNAYRATLPTDGWVYDGFGGGFSLDLLGLPSGIKIGDIPVAIAGVPVEQIANRPLLAPGVLPPGWRAGSSVAYSLDRGGQIVSVQVPIVQWDLAKASKAFTQWLAAWWSTMLIAILYFMIGAFVFYRRQDSPAAQVLLFLGVIRLSMNFLFSGSIGDNLDRLAFTAVALLGNYIWAMLLFPTLFLLSLVFPRPKQPVRDHPRLTLAALYLVVPLGLFTIGTQSNLVGGFAGFGMVAVYGLLTVASIIHTFFQVRADPVGRAQVKWVGLGVALVAGYQLVFNVIFLSTNFSFFAAEPWWSGLLDGLVTLSLPVTVGIAILRYRLFDIDVIIRRTLQYSLVTGLLVLVYFGSVVLGQRLAGALTGRQDSPLVVVISTLLIAALFNPVRRAAQDFIDRRFYRRKYDALQTLAAFTETARDETRLEALEPALLQAVQDSLQPEQAWLWLKGKECF